MNTHLIFAKFSLQNICRSLKRSSIEKGKIPELQRSIISYLQALEFFEPKTINKWDILQRIANVIAVNVSDNWESNDDTIWIDFFKIHFDRFDEHSYMTPEPDPSNPRKKVEPLTHEQVENVVCELAKFVDLTHCLRSQDTIIIRNGIKKSYHNTVNIMINIIRIIQEIRQLENQDKRKNPNIKYFFPEQLKKVLGELFPDQSYDI